MDFAPKGLQELPETGEGLKIDDVPELEKQMQELDEVANEMRNSVRRMAAILSSMTDTCGGDSELLGIMGQERRYLGQFRAMVEDLSITRRLRRRLPAVAARLREQERSQQEESAAVQREAAQIKQDLESVLRKFLRGG